MLKHSTPKLREAILKLFNLTMSSGPFTATSHQFIKKVTNLNLTTIEASHKAAIEGNYFVAS